MNYLTRKMCYFAEIDYDEIDWSSNPNLELTWSLEQQNAFRDWLAIELKFNKVVRDKICKYPRLVTNKFMRLKIANEFVFQYGFKLKKEDEV